MKKWRINLIFILIILFGAAIISRLVYYQIVKQELYKALAQGQQGDFQTVKGERGKIFFNQGEILATNIKGKYVFICPDEIKEKEKTARELSQIFDLEKELILEKIERDSLFEKIKSSLTKEEEQTLKEINLSGVHLAEAVFRQYPQETMASQVIGFFGGEEKGQYGIEAYYDDFLQGKEKVFSSESSEGSNKGADIFLTIDYNVQFIAEKLLAKAKENLNIKGGQIIVLDPNTGRIFALAHFPDFDPNHYSEIEDFQTFKNGAIQKLFEPGSVFKPITMAAALDQGKITPQSAYIDSGKVSESKL